MLLAGSPRIVLGPCPNIYGTTIRATVRVVAGPQPQWKTVDWELVKNRLADKLREMTKDYQLLTVEKIDGRVADITAVIHETAEEAIPKARQSQYAKLY